MIQVPPKRLKAGEEQMVGLAIIAAGQEILVWAGKQYLRMATKDLEHYRGERAKRGRKLPKGYQRVTLVEIAPAE
jgi:topoisomerase-4 subunit A